MHGPVWLNTILLVFWLAEKNPSICIYSSMLAWKTKYCLQSLARTCGLDLKSKCSLYPQFCEKLTKGVTQGKLVWDIPGAHAQEQTSWEGVGKCFSCVTLVFWVPSALALCGGEFPAHWYTASAAGGQVAFWEAGNICGCSTLTMCYNLWQSECPDPSADVAI